MTDAARRRILVVEDDTTLSQLLASHLERLGYDCRVASGRAKALEQLADFSPDLALLDLRLPDVDGQAFLPELREYCAVIIVTAYGSIDQAVQSVRAGAADFLVKPVTALELEIVLTRFFQTLELSRDLAYWQSQASIPALPGIAGESESIERLRRTVSLFASVETPILVVGEPGTGKEIVARTIHAGSPRANGRFISVDCDPGLEARELFGSWNGDARSEGLLAAAEAGTIFLAGIEKLDHDLHTRLLRAIETGQYRVDGSSINRPARARFVMSTAMTMPEVMMNACRCNLIHYLSTFVIEIPPLRHRRSDIVLLAREFLERRSFQRGVEKDFTHEAMAMLEGYDWPGNVRELGNAIERAVIMSQGATHIGPEHFNLPISQKENDASEVVLRFASPPTLEELRDSYLALLLDRHQNNRRRAAEVAGISERNIYRLLRKDDKK